MTRLETRYPCPVCLGVKMEKVTLQTGSSEAQAAGAASPDIVSASSPETSGAASRGVPGAASRGVAGRASHPAGRASGPLVLDHCPRCGGVWFEAGEVQQLRKIDATELWRGIVQRDGAHSMQCHSCRSYLPRTAETCFACGWRVELDCPVCDRPMRRSEQSGMRLDYCTHCRGVWFDHDELTGIWKMEVDALVKRRGTRTVDAAGDVMLLDVLLYDPFVMYYGIHAAGHAAGAAADAIVASGSIEVVGEVAGATGEVASSLFETIVGIIGGIFG